MNWLEKKLHQAEDLWDRSLDRHVRIAVTGLSGAGKTAFITSLINQLLHAPNDHHLTFFQVDSEHRLKATKLMMHEELHIPSFDYQGAIHALTSDNPSWAPSTVGISQAQIKCRYEIKDRWLKKLKSESAITLDIVDYPGEWLLDLPLLNLSFKEWSKLCLSYISSERRKPYTTDVKKNIETLNYEQDYSDPTLLKNLDDISQSYRESLSLYRQNHNDYSLALPGRFILPGDLSGAPALSFFPVINRDILSIEWDDFASDSLLKVLERRFDYYKDKIVKPFFKEYFSKVDRQIVLIDTLSVLESNYDSYQDLKSTIEKLLNGFSYGRANWFRRLFSPSIDKLMIVTSKADLVPPDQHHAIESFMQKLVGQVKNDIGFEGVEVDTMAISAIATSEPVSTEYQGQNLLCVKGIDIESGEPVINYPGLIPNTSLSREQWQQLAIDFSPFAIPQLNPDEALPHIRMDKVLQYLVGDKFA